MNDTCVIELKVPENIVLRANVDGLENACIPQRYGEKCSIEVAISTAGQYKLIVLTKNLTEPGSYYDKCIEILLNVKGSLNKHQGFPPTYYAYTDEKCLLYSPKTYSLQTGENIKFEVRMPGAKKASMFMNHEWKDFVNKGDDIFTGNFIIAGKDPIHFCADFHEWLDNVFLFKVIETAAIEKDISKVAETAPVEKKSNLNETAAIEKEDIFISKVAETVSVEKKSNSNETAPVKKEDIIISEVAETVPVEKKSNLNETAPVKKEDIIISEVAETVPVEKNNLKPSKQKQPRKWFCCGPRNF